MWLWRWCYSVSVAADQTKPINVSIQRGMASQLECNWEKLWSSVKTVHKIHWSDLKDYVSEAETTFLNCQRYNSIQQFTVKKLFLKRIHSPTQNKSAHIQEQGTPIIFNLTCAQKWKVDQVVKLNCWILWLTRLKTIYFAEVFGGHVTQGLCWDSMMS